jgi:hypothetical protein
VSRLIAWSWDAIADGFRPGNLHHFWDTEWVRRLGADPRQIATALTGMALDHPSRYGWGMKPHWRKWMLMAGGVLVAVSFGALFLALSGRPDQWITLALASALIVIVVLRLFRRHPPNA